MHGGYLYDGAFPQALASVRAAADGSRLLSRQRRNRLLLFAPTCAPVRPSAQALPVSSLLLAAAGSRLVLHRCWLLGHPALLLTAAEPAV